METLDPTASKDEPAKDEEKKEIKNLEPTVPAFAAARVGDLLAHAGAILPPGVLTVLIGNLPAAVVGPTDLFACPSCVGAPLILGCLNVLIGERPAVRVGDIQQCPSPIPNAVISGCPTVFIGMGSGSGGGAGGGAGAGMGGGSVTGAIASAAITGDAPPTDAPVENFLDVTFEDSSNTPMDGEQ